MLIWDNLEGFHNIRIDRVNMVKLTKYLNGSDYVNRNVTVSQAQTVANTFLNNSLSGTKYHCYIHIFSMPKKTEENVPFDYVLWVGPTSLEPSSEPGREWWEGPA